MILSEEMMFFFGTKRKKNKVNKEKRHNNTQITTNSGYFPTENKDRCTEGEKDGTKQNKGDDNNETNKKWHFFMYVCVAWFSSTCRCW